MWARFGVFTHVDPHGLAEKQRFFVFAKTIFHSADVTVKSAHEMTAPARADSVREQPMLR